MALLGTPAIDSPSIVNPLGLQELQDGDGLILSGRAWIRYRNQALGPVTNIPVGDTAYGSVGTNLVTVAGTKYRGNIYLPGTKIVTGIKVLQGATVGTDLWIAQLWSADGQTQIGTSILTGTATAGADSFLTCAFVTPVTIPPGTYWLVLQSNGTTDKFRAVKTLSALVLGDSATGAFGTIAAFTPPTTFTADKSPVAQLY